MVEENPRVGGRLKSDTERLQERDFEGGGRITICSDFGAPKNQVDTVSTVSPSISHEVVGPDAMILVF